MDDNEGAAYGAAEEGMYVPVQYASVKGSFNVIYMKYRCSDVTLTKTTLKHMYALLLHLKFFLICYTTVPFDHETKKIMTYCEKALLSCGLSSGLSG